MPFMDLCDAIRVLFHFSSSRSTFLLDYIKSCFLYCVTWRNIFMNIFLPISKSLEGKSFNRPPVINECDKGLLKNFPCSLALHCIIFNIKLIKASHFAIFYFVCRSAVISLRYRLRRQFSLRSYRLSCFSLCLSIIYIFLNTRALIPAKWITFIQKYVPAQPV